MIQFAPLKNKNDFFYLSKGIEICKMSGKNHGKVRILRWMISSGNPELDTSIHLAEES